MTEESTGLLDNIRTRVHQAYRSRILHIASETTNSYALSGGGKGLEEFVNTEPSADLRARTDGENVALSFTIPADRHTSFILSLSGAAKDNNIAEIMKRNFNYPKNEFMLQMSRNETGNLQMYVSVEGLELENRKDGNSTKSELKKNSFYAFTNEMQSNARIILKGKNDSRLSIRIHDNLPQNYTEREKYLIANEPQVRRIHNEAWLNSLHIPSAYVEDDYDPNIDGSVLEFLKANDKGYMADKWKWAPFCPDRDKYWGIAARDPHQSCDTLPDMDICIVKSDTPGIQHGRLPLDMPRTYLSNETIIYLKPVIDNKGRKQETEGQTGLIHLGDNVHDGWYYVTQPIPKLNRGNVEGYFALIGRRATLTSEKEQALYDAFWKDKL